MSEPLVTEAPAPTDGAKLPLTYAEHVYTRLEREITEGRLEGGQRVTEVELAERLGVSRTPVREALKKLARSGLVVHARGRGTFVAPPMEADELLTLYAARVVVEPFLAARAAHRITADALAVMRATQTEFHAVLARGEIDQSEIRRLVDMDSTIHLTMYDAAQSSLTLIVESYWSRTIRERQSVYSNTDHAHLTRFARAHDAIIDALSAQDGESAQRLVAAHLQSGIEVLESALGSVSR